MPRRRIGQLSWVDGALAGRGRRRDVLGEIDRLVDWQPFERLLSGIHGAAKGEAAYPPLMMFKVVLLQRWYGLSDPQMEEALFDRVSFLGFVGLSLEDETPDHTTIWRFRQKLVAGGLIEGLFAELSRQLDGHGITIKQGTLIDASIIQSAARRPRMGEGKVSQTDPDARFGANNERGRFTFGYKVHIAVDQGSSTIGRWRVTPANVQEVTVAPELLPATGRVYADRGYDAAACRAGGPRPARRHHAAGAQAPTAVGRADRPQPRTLADPARGGVGFRHAQALLQVPPHAVLQCSPQCRGLRTGLHRLQHQAMARPRHSLRSPGQQK